MTKNCTDKNYPDCFGDLEIVFPKGKRGLRNTPKTCLSCLHKTACLGSAMKGAGGLIVREEMLDRAYQSGMMSFFERWSKKKQLACHLKKN
jgi:hypothetical protein